MGGALPILADRHAILGAANFVRYREHSCKRDLTKPRSGLVSREMPPPSEERNREFTWTNMAWMPKSTAKPQRKAWIMQHHLGIQHHLTDLCNKW